MDSDVNNCIVFIMVSYIVVWFQVIDISGLQLLEDLITDVVQVDVIPCCGHSMSTDRPGAMTKSIMSFREKVVPAATWWRHETDPPRWQVTVKCREIEESTVGKNCQLDCPWNRQRNEMISKSDATNHLPLLQKAFETVYSFKWILLFLYDYLCYFYETNTWGMRLIRFPLKQMLVKCALISFES